LISDRPFFLPPALLFFTAFFQHPAAPPIGPRTAHL